ncbi:MULTISPECIES: histidine phosphatase family protein [Parafrankia]|uniref:SixA phosphatase family protein n=1 Tax=Parafrankia TaxID=2994362 RepID=UPI0009F6D715|nr:MULTISPECIES: phosphoglycerate mutase family protein [Parafrankia]TCJ31990.1 phosphoglycerate mutase [Parafrankia sp. BMG5.11]CAI7976635.1 Phosphohistidine phosphatase, SixA (Modular protein) [Frankia sp. Hr75.2]SQD96853.1 Putative phosphohistidine phosphatase, SixA (modular protein) [Parafrankia sp. Ea1.12]
MDLATVSLVGLVALAPACLGRGAVDTGGATHPRTVVIVRHALALPKNGWTGVDAARPLTARGIRQAKAFAGVVVRDLPVRRVLTSPALRCEQTVAPLAVDRALPLRRCAVLGVEGSTESLLDLLASDEAEDSVLCTHGERIRDLFQAWQARGWHGWPSADGRTRKGDGWLLRGHPPLGVTVEYLATPEQRGQDR